MNPCCPYKGCTNPPRKNTPGIWYCDEHAGTSSNIVTPLSIAAGKELDSIAAMYGLRRGMKIEEVAPGIGQWMPGETDDELRSRIKANLHAVSTFKNGFLENPVTHKPCTHEFVEMGFMHSKMVCKHCDQEQR